MARNAEPFSPFIPWQIDDNPALFLSVNVYDSLLRMTPDGKGIEAGLADQVGSQRRWPELDLHAARRRQVLRRHARSRRKTSRPRSRLAAKSEKSAWASNYKAIKDVQVVDPKTIKIILSEPYPALPSVMAMFCAAILPADLVKASDAKDFDVTTAWKTRGTGAYYVEGWKKGDPIILKRNPNYWKGTPDVDEVRIEYIPDDNTRILKLQGGEVDVIDFVPLSQLATVGHAAEPQGPGRSPSPR